MSRAAHRLPREFRAEDEKSQLSAAVRRRIGAREGNKMTLPHLPSPFFLCRDIKKGGSPSKFRKL
jgi:hypothetical protein